MASHVQELDGSCLVTLLVLLGAGAWFSPTKALLVSYWMLPLAFGEMFPSTSQLALFIPTQTFCDIIAVLISVSYWSLGYVKIPDLGWPVLLLAMVGQCGQQTPKR